MRETWVVLILRLSAYIYHVKQHLLVVHAIKGFFYIFYIFFLELILFWLSLPLYLIVPPHRLPRSGQLDYRLRRNITLIFLVVISCMWLGQLLFILIVSRSIDSPYSFDTTGGTSTTTRIYTLPVEAELATVSSRIKPPVIEQINVSQSNSFTIFGTAEPYQEVVVYAEYNNKQKFIKVYHDTSNENGHWSVYHDPQISVLPAGTYRIYATSYNDASFEKSSFSSVSEVLVHNSWGEWFRMKGSLLLNITIIIVIIIIFLLTLLTL